MAVKSIWTDPAVQKLLQSQVCQEADEKGQIQESAAFFLDSLDRIFDPAYSPTKEDILKIRVPTTGIIEANFQLKWQGLALNFRLIDVGGQRYKNDFLACEMFMNLLP